MNQTWIDVPAAELVGESLRTVASVKVVLSVKYVIFSLPQGCASQIGSQCRWQLLCSTLHHHALDSVSVVTGLEIWHIHVSQ